MWDKTITYSNYIIIILIKTQYVNDAPLPARHDLGMEAPTYDLVPPHLAMKHVPEVAMSPPAPRCKMKARRPFLQPKAQRSRENSIVHNSYSEAHSNTKE